MARQYSALNDPIKAEVKDMCDQMDIKIRKMEEILEQFDLKVTFL